MRPKVYYILKNCYIFPGLKVVAQTFPEGMTTGNIPASWLASPPSSRRKKSTLPQQQPQAAETRWWFTEDELAKIQEQLDKLLPYNNCSSKAIVVSVHTRVYSRMFSYLFSCSHCLRCADQASSTNLTSSSRTTARSSATVQRIPWR